MYQDALPRRALLGVRVDRELRVERVLGGLAVEVGLEPGDRIAAVDGAAIATTAALAEMARRIRGGARVAIRFERNGKAIEKAAIAPPLPVEPGVLLGEVVSRGVRLRTFFALPEEEGERLPAVVWLPGIRADSQEAPLDPDAPIRAFVSAFVAAGFAAVRVERSGVGDSEGPSPRETGLDAEVDAHRAALAETLAFDEIDPERVIVVGHSLGGMIAPLLARETPLAGACVYGTSARRWHETALGTTRRQTNRTKEEIDAWLELFDLVHRARMTPAEAFASRPHLERLRSRDCDGATMYGRHVSLFQELDAIDLIAAWRETMARAVLAMHGDGDTVCMADESREIAEASRGTFMELEGACHDIGPRAIAAMVAWAQTVTDLQPPGKTQP